MGMIPRSFIDDLIARVDIVELIDSVVPLKRSGKNYSACCPFHKEKTPSFTVSPDKQFYHCFGCGQSGNSLGFVMEYYRSDFVEAVESLASRVGLEVPRETSIEQSQEHSLNRKLYDLLEKANEHYQLQLRQAPDKERAVSYLKGRGLSGKIAKHFQIGYAPPGWNSLLSADAMVNYPADLFVQAGLTIAKNEHGAQDKALQYDRFRDRIIFPIRDARGRCIGFGGRVFGDEKPKYLNSPETPVFNKGKELYGLYEAKQANNKLHKVIVVEGYMDVIALAQMGITNAVATLGTAIGSDHLHLIFRSLNEVVFCFDGDHAGRQAAERALHNSLPFLQDGRQLRFLFLAEGEDPDSVVRKEGPELFQHKIDNAQPLSEFLFEHLSKGLNLNTMDGRASLAKQATPLINQMPKGLFYEMMIARLAEITHLENSVIAKSLQEAEQAALKKAEERASQEKLEIKKTPPVRPLEKHTTHPFNDGMPPMETYLDQQNINSHFDTSGGSDIDFAYPAEDEFNPYSGRHSKEAAGPRVSTVNRLLAHLLRQPELALNCQIPEEVYKLQTHNIDLLIELLNYIKSSENRVSTAMILGHWHNTAEGFLLASLAASEALLDSDASEKEFKDSMERLIAEFFKQEASQFQSKWKNRPPTSEESARYLQLEKERRRFKGITADEADTKTK